jgi:hypothetical protein
MVIAIIGYLAAVVGYSIYLATPQKDESGQVVPKSGLAIAGAVIGGLFSLLIIWLSINNFMDASKCVKIITRSNSN